MKALLDTHVLLWLLEGRLSARAMAELAPAEGYVSHATVWELTIKAGTKRLVIPDGFLERIEALQLIMLPITLAHISQVGALPRLHGDPFDRMLVAQTIVEDMILFTHDRAVLSYPVATYSV